MATRRARQQAEAVAGEISVARAGLGATRAEISRRAGVSADTERRVEEGHPSTQLDTLCAVGAAVGLDIVVKAYPSTRTPLRDSRQLQIGEALCAIAHASWSPRLEVAAGQHGEAIDIGFFGPLEIIATEIDRLIVDFQAQYRRNTQKRDELARRHSRSVRLVMVVEDTRRNRAALAPHADFIRSALSASSREILIALRTGKPLGRDGLLWFRRYRPPPGAQRIDRRFVARAHRAVQLRRRIGRCLS